MTILQSRKLARPCLRRAGRSRSYGGKRIGNCCHNAHNRAAENSAWEVLLKFVDPDPLALRPPCAASAGGGASLDVAFRAGSLPGAANHSSSPWSRNAGSRPSDGPERGAARTGALRRPNLGEGRGRRLNAAGGFSGGAGRCWHCGRRIERQVDVHCGERVLLSMRGRAGSQRSRALTHTADAVRAVDRLRIVLLRSSLPVPAEVAGGPWMSGRRVTPRAQAPERGRSA